jgi:uncharacterized membrane protein
MPSSRLLQLLGLIAVLNVLHLVDHIFRGDFHWPIDEQSVGSLVLLLFSVLGTTVFAGYLWRRGAYPDR